jgi:hypothetical protein
MYSLILLAGGTELNLLENLQRKSANGTPLWLEVFNYLRGEKNGIFYSKNDINYFTQYMSMLPTSFWPDLHPAKKTENISLTSGTLSFTKQRVTCPSCLFFVTFPIYRSMGWINDTLLISTINTEYSKSAFSFIKEKIAENPTQNILFGVPFTEEEISSVGIFSYNALSHKVDDFEEKSKIYHSSLLYRALAFSGLMKISLSSVPKLSPPPPCGTLGNVVETLIKNKVPFKGYKVDGVIRRFK